MCVLSCGPSSQKNGVLKKQVYGLVIDAVDSATWYTYMGIGTTENIGSGHGPLNHLHSTTKVLIPRSVSCPKRKKKVKNVVC